MDVSSVPLAPAAPQPPKLLEQLRQRIRVLHDSIRTEQAYVDWARHFILFHGKRHPREMGAPACCVARIWTRGLAPSGNLVR